MGAPSARKRLARKYRILELCLEIPRTKRELVEMLGCSEAIVESLMGELISEKRLVKEHPPGTHVELWSGILIGGR